MADGLRTVDPDLEGMMVSVTSQYLEYCQRVMETVQRQSEAVEQAAGWFADSILADRMVHVFGSGHSRIMVEEMWPRYGSFPGFNPIVELSLSFHHPVVGCNGQRQAMFLENVTGLAERILRNFAVSTLDSALVVSSSGCNAVPVEMARQFRDRGVRVVSIVSLDHCRASQSALAGGEKLTDCSDLVLDTGAPVGDAAVRVEGWPHPVAPLSTIGGCMLVNCLKAETAARLAQAGHPAHVLTAPALAGPGPSRRIFEAAYDEHARRLAALYIHPQDLFAEDSQERSEP
jgi:uncharacterized phosphosugar-binding protein